MKNKGYIVPVAIVVLVVVSLGLLLVSWLGSKKVIEDKVEVNKTTNSTTTEEVAPATDDQALQDQEATIDAQIKALDKSDVEINNSLNDKSTI